MEHLSQKYGGDYYVIPVNPEPWAVGPLSVGRRNGKIFPSMGRNAELDSYKEAIREEMQGGIAPMISGPVKLTFWFWRRLEEYRRADDSKSRKHQADATNLQKALEDALQGILYENDRDVVDVRSYIVEQGKDVKGKVMIRVDKAPENMQDTVPWEAIGLLERADNPAIVVQPDPYREGPVIF